MLGRLFVFTPSCKSLCGYQTNEASFLNLVNDCLTPYLISLECTRLHSNQLFKNAECGFEILHNYKSFFSGQLAMETLLGATGNVAQLFHEDQAYCTNCLPLVLLADE